MKKSILFRITSNFLTFLVGLSAIIVIYAAVSLNDTTFFGYRLFMVLTGSMTGVIDKGELIVTKVVPIEELHEKDVISFYSPDPAIWGEVNTHRIERIVGQYYYTKGAANSEPDKYPVLYSDIVGKVVLHSKKLGSFFGFICKPTNMLLFVLLPIIVFAVYDITKNFKRLKRLAATDAESAKTIKPVSAPAAKQAQEQKPNLLPIPKPIPETLLFLKNKPNELQVSARKQPRQIQVTRTNNKISPPHQRSKQTSKSKGKR